MRNRVHRFVYSLSLLCLLVGLASSPAAAAGAKGPSPKTELLWDTWGVPHIFASSEESLFRAFGRAQAEAHGNLILRLYAQARGRGAEFFGERYVGPDRITRTLRIPQIGQSWYASQQPEFKRDIDAFVDGFNQYLTFEHPENLNPEAKAVLPIQGSDIFAHMARVFSTFLAGASPCSSVMPFQFDVELPRAAPASVADSPVKPTAASALASSADPAFAHTPLAGSNGWAIGPSRSASGNSLLLANPHLLWADLHLWFEAQLEAPGISSYGASLVGMPVPGIAFNEEHGWTHTVNTLQGCELYQLTQKDGGYLFDGKIEAFQERSEDLKVRRADGSLESRELKIREARQGPVFQTLAGGLVSARIAALKEAPAKDALLQWWEMSKAHNLDEFQAALKRMQLPLFNVIYSDRAGHIFLLYAGIIPDRSGYDFRPFMAGAGPGDSSKSMWTRIHAYEELPKLLDPPSGWLQNANSPPWFATFPEGAPKREDYAADISYPLPMSFREQRSVRMIEESGPLTLDKLIENKYSARSELADRILPELVKAALDSEKPLVKQAGLVLASWNREASAESQGMLLFLSWYQAANALPGGLNSLFAAPWDPANPKTTPAGLGNLPLALKLLEGASAQLMASAGRLDLPWGTVARMRFGTVDFPANGGPGELGIFRALLVSPMPGGKLQVLHGDSYISAVEFSSPVKAKTLLSYGNSSEPGSSHRGDQLELAAKRELRPTWRTKEEIEAHLEKREAAE